MTLRCEPPESKERPPDATGCPAVERLIRTDGRITCEASVPSWPVTGLVAPFSMVGLSHKTSSLELRSAVGLTKEQIPSFLRKAKAAGLTECIALSTCNRTEIYFVGGNGMIVAEALADHAGLPIDDLRDHVYERPCVCAACHVFRVTSGLDSAVLGENEIVAQVREAWSLADSEGMVGPMLNLLFKRAIEASKRIRTETSLTNGVVSTATLAVQEAVALAGPLDDKRLLLLGAGKIGRRLAKNLAGVRCTKAIVANRTLEKAESVAQILKGEARGFDELEELLVDTDVVFATVGAGRSVIDADTLGRVMSRRPDRSLLIVDLGVPPNVQGGIEIAGLRTIGLNELNGKSAANTQSRNGSVKPSLLILDEELGRFKAALIERAASPTIRALLSFGESVRQRNLEWARERLPDMDEQFVRIIEELTRRTVIGLLESPIHALKTDVAWAERRHLLESLFSIGGGD